VGDVREGISAVWIKILKSRIVQNVLALFSTQVAAYAFPLVTVPYLARVLGPYQWGMVALAQALGLYLSMVVDFGFQLSATRRVARVRHDDDQVAYIMSGVLGAKLILAGVCIAAIYLAQIFVPAFQQQGAILWAGAVSGVGQGFSMLWYYQGLENMRVAAAAEVSGKAIACLGIFLFVHRPGDAWIVLALQCLCYTGVALFQWATAHRQVRFLRPSREATWQAMRDSAAMFLFRSSVSLYTTANALILGAICTPLAVGFYSGAERLTRAALSLLTPVSQSLYPRISRLVITDARKALRLTRISLGVMTLGGSVMAIGVAIAAPLIIRLLLGAGYEQAVPVLRVLALLIPATAASTVLGIQWMLPLGMEGAYNVIVISAGLVNLALSLCWASRWQQVGMAWAVVATEYLVTAAICAMLARGKMIPLSGAEELPLRLQKQFSAAAAL
jgi:PST family polysaccharide transporter